MKKDGRLLNREGDPCQYVYTNLSADVIKYNKRLFFAEIRLHL